MSAHRKPTLTDRLKPALAKAQAWARRPFAQIIFLIILVGASAEATERLVMIYKTGAPVSFFVVGWHLVVAAALTLLFSTCDRVEARMLRGDRADEREARLRARFAQILQGRGRVDSSPEQSARRAGSL